MRGILLKDRPFNGLRQKLLGREAFLGKDGMAAYACTYEWRTRQKKIQSKSNCFFSALLCFINVIDS